MKTKRDVSTESKKEAVKMTVSLFQWVVKSVRSGTRYIKTRGQVVRREYKMRSWIFLMGFFVANSNIEGFCILKGESFGNFISESAREMSGVRLSNLNAEYNYWLSNSEKYTRLKKNWKHYRYRYNTLNTVFQKFYEIGKGWLDELTFWRRNYFFF